MLVEDHQIKQLKKFKQTLEKNMFNHERYTVYIKTEEELDAVERNLTI